MCHRFCYLFFLTILSTSVFAQQANSPTAAIEPLSSSYLLQLTLGLVAVVAVIFLLAWVLKRFNLTQQSQTGVIKVISGLSLGARDRVVLVQVGEEQILLGLSPGRITKLHSLVTPVAVESAPDATPVFADKLNRLMRSKGEQ